MDCVVVTGGAGFIGSHFVRRLLSRPEARVVVLDKLTYAGNLSNLDDVKGDPRFSFVHADIANRRQVDAVYRDQRPRWVVNFAAESHVDRSIEGPRAFLETNTVGTFEMLDSARGYFAELAPADRSRFRFLHVSTDEVYGTLGSSGMFHEGTPYAPNSPYAASKAAADHFVRAYHETYGLPTIITNCSNNYGPFQFPEKLIPLMVLNAMDGRPLPVYGDGGNIRDWLYVEDHCDGILLVLQKGQVGERYNIGGENERTNLQVVDRICAALEEILPSRDNPSLRRGHVSGYRDLQTFVEDRPGHDRRYAIDATKIRSELGWQPQHDFETGMLRTVRWYVENRQWCEGVQSGRYQRERLGLLGSKTAEKAHQPEGSHRS